MRGFLVAILLGLFLASPGPVLAGGDVWVNGYTRRDGTSVPGYYRSAPDNDRSNNYGSRGSWQTPSTPYNQRDYDGDGLFNQDDSDDDNDGISDNNE